MLYSGSKFNIFNERELSEYLSSKKSQLRKEVRSEAENKILNAGEAEYIKYLVSKYSVNNLEIHFDDKYVSSHEKEIPADCFPRSFDVRQGKKYKKNLIRYHLPFSGDQELLRCAPSRRLMWTLKVVIEDGTVCFDVVDFYGEADKIKRKANSNIDSIKRQLSNVREQVGKYNSSLRQIADQIFKGRKEQLLKKSDLLGELGVPIKEKRGVPRTFSVPAPDVEKRIRVKKPDVNEAGFQPEPALDSETYRSILQVVHEVGSQFERMPATYAGKGEEALRDHFLLFLEPNFEGSATGETFNKSGKTDILLRYEGENVFIAECKFWKGEKSFRSTISQLLGYLTWRDSKSAIVVFVQNKDFSSVLEKIPDAAAKHPNFIDQSGRTDENWFDFFFHLEGDPNREVKTAVMLYHIP